MESHEEIESGINLIFGKKKRPKKVTNKSEKTKNSEKEDNSNFYNYENLLDRLYNKLNVNHMEKEKININIPQLAMIGGKKCCIINFGEICNQINRNYEHVMKYISIELYTMTSLNPENQLILRGKFRIGQIQSVLKSYIKKYVICNICKNYHTQLIKEKQTKLNFLSCQNCNAKYSVESLKQNISH